MGRPEALALGFMASGVATGVAGWMWGQGNLMLAALFGVVGLYGFVTLRVYRRWVLGMHYPTLIASPAAGSSTTKRAPPSADCSNQIFPPTSVTTR